MRLGRLDKINFRFEKICTKMNLQNKFNKNIIVTVIFIDFILHSKLLQSSLKNANKMQ